MKRGKKGVSVKLGILIFLFVFVIAGSFVLALKPSVGVSPSFRGKVITQCNDHLDNDGDGRCDYSWRKAYCSDRSILGDSDCVSKDDNNEGLSCSVVCTSNSNCGSDGYINNNYCGTDGNVYRDYKMFTCQNAGTCNSACTSSLNNSLVSDCGGLGCTDGQCNSPPTSQEVKIAFIGDQDINANAKAVLQLIKDEGAELVLHMGDLGYGDESSSQRVIDWDNQINNILGVNFPYIATIGNHDVTSWSGYRQKLTERLSRTSTVSCTGDYGVKSSCYYKGLFFILSGVGTMGTGHTQYIQQELTRDNSIWSICSWHKNQQAMQIGGKTDEVGWEAYEECRKGGAIIATAHEHSYSRTKNLINTQLQTVDPVWNSSNSTRVALGSTFAFVSGLGGSSIRPQLRCLPTNYPYGCNNEWASIYTSNQGANFGALFCTFNIGNDPKKGECYFKDISGRIPDRFTIVSELQ